jgi:hypothetical protein
MNDTLKRLSDIDERDEDSPEARPKPDRIAAAQILARARILDRIADACERIATALEPE